MAATENQNQCEFFNEIILSLNLNLLNK